MTDHVSRIQTTGEAVSIAFDHVKPMCSPLSTISALNKIREGDGLNHAVSGIKISPYTAERLVSLTYAMMLTLFPAAFCSITSASFAARASMEPDEGTVAVKTSTPFASNASRMPLQ